MFEGSIPALPSPFRGGKFDEAAYAKLVARQIGAGSHGLVPCGTTGEAPTLSDAEWARAIEICVREAKGKIPVIAGCGTNSTAATAKRARQAETLKADVLLVVTPYYNKPTQEGLFRHFEAVARAVEIPILIYNIPGRTCVDMSVETMVRLAGSCPNIKGVKDATGDLPRVKEMRRALGDRFAILSGEDELALAFNREGGQGCISVTANVAPELCAESQTLCRKGKFDKAEKIHERLVPLHRALFVETNPAPVKYALSRLGLCSPEVRLPLVELSESSRRQVDKVLGSAGLLED